MTIGGAADLYSQSYVRPMNYKLKNNSSVSDSYKESIKAGNTQAVAPVQYPNAQRVTESQKATTGTGTGLSRAQVSKMYNDIAKSFDNQTIGYAKDSEAEQYSVIGANIDYYV